jgi:transcriptional regulator with XRE-family HTH domain
MNKGMSQDELAKRCGYEGRSMVSRVESGRVDLPLSKVDLFAKALGVSPAYLAGYEDNQAELDCSMLNLEGQEKVQEYISDLVDSGKYKKHNSDNMVEEA